MKPLLLVLLLFAQEPAPKKTVIVELFTSQGCASCPDADRLMTILAAEANVIPLALHVDYWDASGWKDTFGRKEFGARQEKYATALTSRGLKFTPNAVIDGAASVAGTDRDKIAKAIQDALAEPPKLALEIAVDAAWKVTVKCTPVVEADLHVVALESGLKVEIKAGELDGRVITYDHVVREWKAAKAAATVDVQLARGPAWTPANMKIVAFAQDAKTLRVLQAAQVQAPR